MNDRGVVGEIEASTIGVVLSELQALTAHATSPETLGLGEVFAGDVRTTQTELLVTADAHSLNAALATSESATVSEADSATQQNLGTIVDADSAVLAEIEALLASVGHTDDGTVSESPSAVQFGPPVIPEPIWTEAIVPQAERARQQESELVLAVIAAATWEAWMEP